jgi:hypothetical protein
LLVEDEAEEHVHFLGVLPHTESRRANNRTRALPLGHFQQKSKSETNKRNKPAPK